MRGQDGSSSIIRYLNSLGACGGGELINAAEISRPSRRAIAEHSAFSLSLRQILAGMGFCTLSLPVREMAVGSLGCCFGCCLCLYFLNETS